MIYGQRWNGWNIFSCRRYYPSERLLIWHTYYKKGEKFMYYLQKISFGENNVFMPTIGYNEAKGQTEEQHISYTPTVINGDYITIKAGGNIHIKGSQIAGKKINIEAKKNLTIESNQESYTYKNKNAGIGINVGVKTVSGEVTRCINFNFFIRS